MKRRTKVVILMAGFLLVSTLLWAQNKGAKEIVIPGGTTGSVSVRHHVHQNILGDCNLCHNLFPQTAGIVQKLKDEGKLEKKKVMNQCQKCHREKVNAGLKSGPVTCKGCHAK
ncbi:MAG: cytochrome c3 family protein [Desulfobacterales bacterium]|nr:cytochrome c3 family protein [Desulfobacterales bacterium]